MPLSLMGSMNFGSLNCQVSCKIAQKIGVFSAQEANRPYLIALLLSTLFTANGPVIPGLIFAEWFVRDDMPCDMRKSYTHVRLC